MAQVLFDKNIDIAAVPNFRLFMMDMGLEGSLNFIIYTEPKAKRCP